MLLERYDFGEEKEEAKAALVGREMLFQKHALYQGGGDFSLLGDDKRSGKYRKKRESKRSYSSSIARGRVRFSSRPISQRVVVKAHFKKHNSGGAGAGNLRGHLSYITRSGAGINQERPELFSSVDGDISARDFYELCKNDRHHFRFIISPENGHEISDFKGYVGEVMGLVEEDLGTKLKWVSAVHYDTDNPHSHVVLRGKDEHGKDLVIDRDYISQGVRERAQEVATLMLGERSLEEIQRSMEKETDALRVTSFDRFLTERFGSMEEGEALEVDTRKEGFSGRPEYYEKMLQKRLVFLSTTSMATQDPPGVFSVEYGFMKELKDISERHDIIKQLHRSNVELDEGVSIYKPDEKGAGKLYGEAEKIGHVNELTDHKYMVVRDYQGQRHYVGLPLNARHENLREGSTVEVSTGESPARKADREILAVSMDNDGLYSREKHQRYVEEYMTFIEDAKGYVDFRSGRLEELELSGVLQEGEEPGEYVIPEDLIEQGAGVPGRGEIRAEVRSLAVNSLMDEPFFKYELEKGKGPNIQGRIEVMDYMGHEKTQKYMLVRDGDERLHYAELRPGGVHANLREGAIVELSGLKKTNNADLNIYEISQKGQGVYTKEAHLAHVSEEMDFIKDPVSYVENHETRLKTLEKAGIVEALGEGAYKVPKDITQRGAALNKKLEKVRGRRKEYAAIKPISVMPVQAQAEVHARTFLDLEIYKHQEGKELRYPHADKKTVEAIQKRQDWLLENGYGRVDRETGKFKLGKEDLQALYKSEMDHIAKSFGQSLGYKAAYYDFNQEQKLRYIRSVEAHGGPHLIVGRDDTLTVIRAPASHHALRPGEMLAVKWGEKGKGLDVRHQREDLSKAQVIERTLKDHKGVQVSEWTHQSFKKAHYLESYNLKEGVYAAISDGKSLSFVRTDDVPAFKRGELVDVEMSSKGSVSLEASQAKQKQKGKAVQKEQNIEIEF